MKNKGLNFIVIGLVVILMTVGFNPMLTDIEYGVSKASAKSMYLGALSGGDTLVIASCPSSIFELDPFRVSVTNLTGDPVEGVTVKIEETNKQRKTNNDGITNLPEFAAPSVSSDSSYTVTAKKDGYNGDSKKVNVKNRFLTLGIGGTGESDGIPTVEENNKFSIGIKDHHDELVTATVVFNGKDYKILGVGTITAPYLLEDGPDTRTYSLYAYKDGYQKSGTKQIEVINVNCPPNKPGKISGPGLGDIGENNVYTYSTSTKDPDEGDVQYLFNWGDKTTTLTSFKASGEKVSATHWWDSKRVYTISVKAIDVHGAESKSSSRVVIMGNDAPNAPTLDGPDYIEAPAGGKGSGIFNAQATDPDGHKIKYRFKWENGEYCSEMVNSGESADATIEFDAGKIYHVEARAVDEYGKEGAWSKSIKVTVGNLRPNKPSLSVRKIGKGAYKAEVTARDPNENDKLKYTIDWNGESSYTSNEWHDNGCGDSNSYTFSGGGLKVIKAYAFDQDNAQSDTASRTIGVILADAGMSMTIEALEVDVIYQMIPSNYVNAEGEVVIVDDSYSVVANQDGTYDVQQNDVTVQEGLESPEAVQTYVATTTTTNTQTGTTDIPGDDDDTGDNNDDDDEDSNSAPHISSISSKSITEGDTLTVSVHASDADGDSLTFSVVQGPGSISGSSQSNSYSSFASSGQQSSYQTVTYTYHAGQDGDCDDETKYVKIKVRDGHGGVDYESFNIYVDDDDSCDDDCCFPAGTLITMADGSFKVIEDVKVGELVLSYNTKDGKLATCKVLETVSPMRKGVYSINDGLVRPTDDHPFYTRKADGRTGWAAINPSHSISGYGMRVMSLEVGDEIFNSDEQWIKIESIEYQPGRIQTYNLEDVSGKSNFFANGVLVHNAADCDSSSNNYMFSSSYSEPDEEQKESNGESGAGVTIQFDGSGSYIPIDTGTNDNDDKKVSEQDEDTVADKENSVSTDAELFNQLVKSLKSIFDQNPKLRSLPIFHKISELLDDLDHKDPVKTSAEEKTANEDINSDDSIPSVQDSSKIKFIWDFGDGNMGIGMYPMHTYETVLSEDSMPDVADSCNSFSPIGIPYKDNPNIVIPSEEDDKDDTINKIAKTITYTVTLYIVLDKDNSIKDENDINLKQLEILDSDTTEITIELQSYTSVNEVKDGLINNGDSGPANGILDIDKKIRLEIF